MNPQHVSQYLAGLGIAPKRWRGQNFLVDHEVVEKMTSQAGLTSRSQVLEIGPGLGILTEELLATAGLVVAVEIETALSSFLQKKFKGRKNLVVINNDILDISPEILRRHFGREPYSIVANLPYQITGQILRRFLTQQPRPHKMIIMVQKEVAWRLVADKPGSMTLLGLSAHYYGQPKFLFEVKRQAFIPSPKVDSAVVSIDLHQPLLTAESEKKFWQLAKIGFTSPRKQLQNNLQSGLRLDKNLVTTGLKKAGLDLKVRPGNLTVDDWVKLAKIF